ncbi:signal transduction histidine kinase [Sinorhizobium terangae]|uniref:Hydrogenase assembly protein HupF n=1 Tax=Sinorhizobium terangae TaxID=110322 RepID=A0A6N7LLP9_SINTE|nr:nickel-dependent hydrogenase large subunit [Sinorhizobium terangae]MBB4188551.1 signal transduction histidine kinase [Sinorhizobium terangae]MQX18159.1 hydrogenase assembly protein HupF [Sinorhizobium terangae]
MTYLLGAGTMGIDVTVSRALACSVAVKANRPRGLARVFVGRRPGEAPALAGQVFSLCSFAQSLASRIAVLNAAGLVMGADARTAGMAGLLAERTFETLRALVLRWPTPLPEKMAVIAGRQLREALAASQAIVSQARSGQIAKDSLAAEATRLSAAAHALGTPHNGNEPVAGSVLCVMLRELDDAAAFAQRSPDPLTAEDDAEVIARLCDEPDFASMPRLPGRVVETGSFARRVAATSPHEPHLGRRLLARISDIQDCLAQLARLASSGEEDWPSLAAGGPTPDAGGYGAVECARGRLYHYAEIGGDGRLAAYRILAPTEWNFHPAGPFVDRLLSLRIGTGGTAARSVSLLALLLDPCVAFEVNIREATHA